MRVLASPQLSKGAAVAMLHPPSDFPAAEFLANMFESQGASQSSCWFGFFSFPFSSQWLGPMVARLQTVL